MTPGRRRQVVACVLWGLVILLVGALVGVGQIAGQEPKHAGLVVVFPERAETSCIQFDEDEVSGAELLRRSGLSVVLSGFGGLGEGVCQIDGTGCSDPSNCFCQCRGADCATWVYYALDEGAWRFQNMGASQRRLQHGDVDGWVWGSGRTPPPTVTFTEVCPLAAAPGQDEAPPPRLGPTAEPSSDVANDGVDEEPDPPAAEERPSSSGAQPTEPARAAPVATDATSPAGAESQVAREGEPSGLDEEVRAASADEDTRGAPAGLIAFGAVAGALVVAVGGVALRRRLRG